MIYEHQKCTFHWMLKGKKTGLLKEYEKLYEDVVMKKPLVALKFDCYCTFSLKEHFQFAFLIVYMQYLIH